MMSEWKKVLVKPDTKIRDTIEVIDLHSLQIAIVVDSEYRLLGTVTDGDIRRGLLKGFSLEEPVEKVMNINPVTISLNSTKSSALKLLKTYKIRHLPIVDNHGHIVGIERLENLVGTEQKENWVVLMVGGLGSRLRPLTDNCPKPMLLIGEKPLLEIILENFISQGFCKFCFSIHFKGEQIKEYFGDGAKWGVIIEYLHERNKLGTAGPLSLFTKKTDSPIVVMNGDILTKVNFEGLINFHAEHKAKVTLSVQNYSYQIPYGVVLVDEGEVQGFEEKPVFTQLINAGIYVIEPQVLERVPKGTYFDMNQLLEGMLKDNESIGVFPIREYWIDIGGMEDYQKATLDFLEVFK